MSFRRSICFLLLVLSGTYAMAQALEVDYTHPRKYVVGGISVEGNRYIGEHQIRQLAGMREGMEVTVPGEDITGIVNRLVAQRYFEDVTVLLDSLSSQKDTAWFKIQIKERPRVSAWTYTGVKSGEKKDLQERLNLRPGREFSDYVKSTSIDIIKRYYKEKGYILADVDVDVQRDTIIKSAIRVNFNVTRGNKIKIKHINYSGNGEIKPRKLAKNMKETHANTWYNFFKSKKFKENEYKTDRKTVLEAFNEYGYRDARLVRDSIYFIDEKHLDIDMDFDQGSKYYFGNITWTGNSVYPSEVLNEVLKIQKGDVYDIVTLQKRLHGGGKETEYDISKLYRDNGYLFFNVTPVEVNIQNDSVDVELRISEDRKSVV